MAGREKSTLTPKQEAFVREYLVDLNATQAAIRAGYSKKTAKQQGTENLAKPAIAAAIQKAMKERQNRVEIDADYVMRTIYETVERCKQAVPVVDQRGQQVMVETPEGEMAPAYTFDAKSVLKGAELLGRHMGFFDKDRSNAVIINIGAEDMGACVRPEGGK